ncbi:nucleotidyltransferase domain-containing protein [Nocardioides aurantiacus]|uniref:Aminoglycoside-2''-adenylyltransferase n=1 Tax=Nocardioides aurantiacus TaxID=86796 RepID=A0A3N2CTU6_9ACTN|nr:aminoglycoside-2''-adenylyltransferase [Nocardioides aurantiacus]
MNDALGAWEPLTPDQVVDVMGGLPCRWWIAGGWALDLHVGHQTRRHEDIDVLVLREDVASLRDHLAGWDLHVGDPAGSLRPWPVEQRLPRTVHDIWCRRSPSSPWSMQVMVDDTKNGEWVYRRDQRIRRPVPELDGPASNTERRVLSPDVQLLYKSRDPRPKDEADFQAAVTHLNPSQRRWLRRSLASTSGAHPWLASL